MKDDSKSVYDQVPNERNLPPSSYDLLIISSFGKVSDPETIKVTQKLIPPHLKASDRWMTDEIDCIKEKHGKAGNCNRIIYYLDCPGAQHSKFYYLEQITIFLQECEEDKGERITHVLHG